MYKFLPPSRRAVCSNYFKFYAHVCLSPWLGYDTLAFQVLFRASELPFPKMHYHLEIDRYYYLDWNFLAAVHLDWRPLNSRYLYILWDIYWDILFDILIYLLYIFRYLDHIKDNCRYSKLSKISWDIILDILRYS